LIFLESETWSAWNYRWSFHHFPTCESPK
jgi:hypothetical protein